MPAALNARVTAFVVATCLAIGVGASFFGNRLPSVRPATSPDSTVSAARALPDLRFIAAMPHPTGTPAHDRVRDYLVDRLRAIGCQDVHIQSATGFNTLDGPIAATIANVVGRKPGRHHGTAILLMAHYDAVPRSFGAADDGEGVVAILETLRALNALPPLDRDVIVVFSDAEEDGLLGAEAFVDLHPWAKDVGTVLNFDARGDQGPVYMFQTSPGNATLIDALATVPDARANSLTGEVYRHLPSDTDLSIWLNSIYPVAAFNFANVDGYIHYHTPIDNLASLDLRTVQQMADYGFGLVRALGSDAVRPARATDAIYFSTPLIGLIRYPVSWALPLALMALLVALIAIAVTVRRGNVGLTGAGWSAAAATGLLVIPAGATYVAWRGITTLHPAFADILQRDPYQSRTYLLFASAMTVAIALVGLRLVARRTSHGALAVAPLLLWGVLGVVVAVVLPGASYLFAWPLLAVALAAIFVNLDRPTGRGVLAIGVAAIPALVLWAALIAALETGLTAHALPLCAMLLALVLTLLTPQLIALDHRAVATRAAAIVAVIALGYAESHAGFTTTRKHPDSLDYVVDADSGTARWISLDRAADTWTRQRLGSDPQVGRLAFPFAHGRPVLSSTATPVAAADSGAPQIAVDGPAAARRVRLHIPRTGPGEIVRIIGDPSRPIDQVSVNGRSLQSGGGSRYSPVYHIDPDGSVLTYYGVPPEGVEFDFMVAGGSPLGLHVETAVEGLPRPIAARPANLMSKPFVATDMTIVERTITVPGAAASP